MPKGVKSEEDAAARAWPAGGLHTHTHNLAAMAYAQFARLICLDCRARNCNLAQLISQTVTSHTNQIK